MGPQILIVEDEADLAQSMVYAFERETFDSEPFTARAAPTGADALRLARELKPDIILLDLMLPDTTGLDVCRDLRADATLGDVPIIMVTASGEEIDRVVGFEVGADDYVCKPFSLRELVLRVKAVLRRRRPQPVEELDGQVAFGRLRLDQEGRQVFVDDEERRITALEYRLLTTLLNRKGRVQTRETLLSDVWGVSPDLTTRTVDTHVKRLREKLGPAGAYVETVRGFGYRFRAQPNDGASA